MADNAGREPMQDEEEQPAYSPWTVVDLVFGHLAAQGLRPTLGVAGNPGEPAADLLRALGIRPTVEGDPRVIRQVHGQLAEMREVMDGIGDD